MSSKFHYLQRVGNQTTVTVDGAYASCPNQWGWDREKESEGEIQGEGSEIKIFRATCLAQVCSQRELKASVLPLDLGNPQLPPPSLRASHGSSTIFYVKS